MQAAAAAAGLPPGQHVTVSVNGDQVTRDLEAPLVAGDTVVFLGPAGVVAGDNARQGPSGRSPAGRASHPGGMD